MNDKELRKFFRRQFAPVSWWLVGYYFLMNVAVIGAVAIQEALFDPTPEQVNGNAWGYLAACIIGMLILLLWKGIPFWKDKVWARGRAMEFKDFLILLMLTIGCQLAASLGSVILNVLLSDTGLSAEASIESATAQPDTLSMLLYAGVLAPVFEELIFRGFAMQTMKPFGKKFAIIGSAILFGLFHGNLFQSPYALLVGLVFGYAAMEYSIGWAMLLHMINNLVLGDMLQRLDALIPGGIVVTLLGLIIIGAGIGSIVWVCVRTEKIRSYDQWRRVDGNCIKGLLFNAGSIVLMVLMALNMLLLLVLPA